MKHWNFRARVWLTRLGLWDRLERLRMRRRFQRGIPHEADFQFFRRLTPPDRLFLDVGANLGQSALSFRCVQGSWPILSLEPNRDLEASLKRVGALLGPTFAYRMIGLGARTETRTLHIPTVDGVAFAQLGSLDRAALENNTEVASLLESITGRRSFSIAPRTIEVVRGDDLDVVPGVIKIDVEGAEFDVLRGLERTIRTHRPILLIESYGPVEYLREIGYERRVLDPGSNELRLPREGEAFVNSFFVPRESVHCASESVLQR